MKKIKRFRELTFRLTRLGLLGMFFFLLTNTPVRAVGEPDLTISKTHTGTFSPLDVGRTYTITVSNIGESATIGTVTVVDTLPDGLSATGLNGTGWNCTLATLTCTRSDSLNNGESYPVIIVTVDVLVGATDPQTNRADVSGGGEVDTFNNTALDDTVIDAKPDLIVTGYELLNSDKASIAQPGVDEVFYIRMKVENQGGAASGNFYPGVFLDDKPNYGLDHDEEGPPKLTLGEVTDFQGYKRTPAGAFTGEGCMYYDPTNSINPMTTPVFPERGNYHPIIELPGLPAGEYTTVDVKIAYPEADYYDAIYDTDGVRTGLKTGTYQIYLYADPNCSGGDVESIEDNNSFGPIPLTVGTGGTMIVKSTASLDGWVLESGETTNTGGSRNKGSSLLYIGDNAVNRQYISILSFDTSGIPDGSVITSVVLKIKYAGIVGTLPFNTHGLLKVDVRKGGFSNKAALQLADFKSAASKKNVMAYNKNKPGNWYTRSFTSDEFVYINQLGWTQFRLYFTKDDNNDFGADFLKIYSGSASATVRPKLIIEYHLP